MAWPLTVTPPWSAGGAGRVGAVEARVVGCGAGVVVAGPPPDWAHTTAPATPAPNSSSTSPTCILFADMSLSPRSRELGRLYSGPARAFPSSERLRIVATAGTCAERNI